MTHLNGNGNGQGIGLAHLPTLAYAPVIGAKKVAIVGSHPATRELAPYDDLSYEIWVFNEAAMKPEVYRRWDAVLQIHAPEVYTSPDNWVNTGHWNWLQEDHGYSEATGERKLIWMQDADPRVPNSVRYPLDEVLGLVPYRYLRSSPSIALALAIYLGYDVIELYGSELSSNTEYTYQAINYAFWIGFAHGRGIDLRLKCWQNEFHDQRLYGFDGELEIDREYFKQRFEEVEKAWRHNDGIYKRTWERLNQAALENKYEEVGTISLELEKAAMALGETLAVMTEAREYANRTQPISRQEFERRSAQAQIDGEQVRADMLHKAGICEYVWNIWRQTGRNDALQQFKIFLKERVDLAHGTGYKLGMYRENIEYLSEYDKRVTAAGGVRALKTVKNPY